MGTNDNEIPHRALPKIVLERYLTLRLSGGELSLWEEPNHIWICRDKTLIQNKTLLRKYV